MHKKKRTRRARRRKPLQRSKKLDEPKKPPRLKLAHDEPLHPRPVPRRVLAEVVLPSVSDTLDAELNVKGRPYDHVLREGQRGELPGILWRHTWRHDTTGETIVATVPLAVGASFTFVTLRV